MLLNELWLQEFKAKRKLYNVTRSKLCSNIGWSVKRLEHIEEGRTKLTDELKENLLMELERFNPDNPLNIMFDYVRIRFSETDVKMVIEKILGIQFEKFQHEDYGFYGYSEHYYLGDIQVMYSSTFELGILIELKGRGCRQFESYLQAQNKSWYEFFINVKLQEGILKRIDLAINDLVGILDIPYLIQKCESEECVSLFRSYKTYKSGELAKLNVVGMGDTLYLGSRTSEIHFCIYKKDYEQYVKFGIDIDEVDIKNRFEIRLRNCRAEKAIDDYLKNNEIENVVFKIINRYVRFVDPESCNNRQRMSLDKKWEFFLGSCREKMCLTEKPEPYSFDKSLNWIKKQVAPTLKTAMCLDKLNGTDIIEKIIKEARLLDKHEAVLNNNVTSIFDMIVINDFLKESET